MTSGLDAPSRPLKLTDRGGERRRVSGDAIAALVFVLWVPAVLVLDTVAGISFQRLLGLATWGLLLIFLRREIALVRIQVAVVVAFATFVEYTFSGWLEVYVYRLDNVPSYVPPGHGLVYLGALILARTGFMQRHQRALVGATIVLLGSYAAWGVTFADRRDALGAFWFVCLLGFFRWGRSARLYVGVAFVVTYLELLGTWLGNWEWNTVGPTGVISIGNPPSGAAGGYGWFDLAAVLAAPTLLSLLRSVGARRPLRA